MKLLIHLLDKLKRTRRRGPSQAVAGVAAAACGPQLLTSRFNTAPEAYFRLQALRPKDLRAPS